MPGESAEVGSGEVKQELIPRRFEMFDPKRHTEKDRAVPHRDFVEVPYNHRKSMKHNGAWKKAPFEERIV